MKNVFFLQWSAFILSVSSHVLDKKSGLNVSCRNSMDKIIGHRILQVYFWKEIFQENAQKLRKNGQNVGYISLS